jgi:hypothetical protein
MQQTQAVDVSSAAKLANQNLSAANTYRETSQNQKKLRREKGTSWQESAKKTSEQLNKISQQQKRFQRNVPTSMDQMLNLMKLTSGSGQTKNYARNLILQAAVKCEPEIKNIIKEESLKALGCSEEQTYSGFTVDRLNGSTLQSLPLAETIFIPLQSLDLITLAGGMLKQNISAPVGKILYESTAATQNNLVAFRPYGGKEPYPMNGTLNNLTNNRNQSFKQIYGQYYQGSSGQYLMDMQYSTSNEFNISGDYIRVALINRSGGTISATSTAATNSVGTFLSDYFSTIKLFDTKNLTAQILNLLTRFLEMQAKLGSGEISQSSKFFKIAQRILGLCFDDRREIDVSGVSKIAELDGIDDSFFEVTEIDLREIDLNVSNVQNGVIELEDCDNVKLPINAESITNQIIAMGEKLSGMSIDQQVSSINQIIDSVSSNPDWKIYSNTNFNSQEAFTKNLIKNLALAVASAALSPKALLPIFVMLAVLQKSAVNTWNQQVTSANTLNETGTTINNTVINIVSDSVQFLKKFKKFSIQVISKIGAIFLRTIFEMLKKDILNILSLIIQDIMLSEKLKKYRTILRLVGIATALAGEIIKGLQDYRKCKSLLDNINNIITIINGIPKKRTKLPVVLAILSDFLPGESPQRATINTIKYLQELGIPTGALPDGSPNLTLQMLFAAQKGDKDEQADNGVSDTFLVPTKEGLPRWVTLPR